MTDIKEEKQRKKKPRGRKIVRVNKKPPKIIKREPVLVGYMRVSTEKQDMTMQHTAIIESGVRPENIFKDTISGSKITRAGRDACIKFLDTGDTLIVWKIDRFSRSLKDLLIHLENFDKRGIGFKSITQNIDTTNPAGRMMMQIVGAFAEFEREIIRERVKAGIKSKLDSGEITQWGRKPRVEYDKKEILKLLKTNSIREVSKITGVPKSTVYVIKKRSKRNGTKTRTL